MTSSIKGRTVSRRKFLSQAPMALICATAISHCPVFAASGAREYIEVETSYGRIRGSKMEGLETFKGIPYAGSVSGANRFHRRWLLAFSTFAVNCLSRVCLPTFGFTLVRTIGCMLTILTW